MIVCPTCGKTTEVSETRAVLSGLRRRRRCTDRTCGGKLTTLEVPVPTGRHYAGPVMLVLVSDIEWLRTFANGLGSGTG